MRCIRKPTPSGRVLAVLICTTEEAQQLIEGQDALAHNARDNPGLLRMPWDKKKAEQIRGTLVEAAYGKLPTPK